MEDVAPAAGPSSLTKSTTSSTKKKERVKFAEEEKELKEEEDEEDEIEYISGSTPKKKNPAGLKRKVVDSDDDQEESHGKFPLDSSESIRNKEGKGGADRLFLFSFLPSLSQSHLPLLLALSQRGKPRRTPSSFQFYQRKEATSGNSS